MHQLLSGLIRVLLLALLITVTPSVFAAWTDPAAAEIAVYESCHLEGKLDRNAFLKAYRNASRIQGNGRIAIIDFNLPSSVPRLFILDLREQKLLFSALVAHGKGSGELMATRFSNTPESHQSSVGLYRVGEKIISPKHGDALLLEGLDKGLNDNARRREIIIHGADYVSPDFVKHHGRLGRSHGCPAVSRAEIGTVINLLQNGGLLYIYAAARS